MEVVSPLAPIPEGPPKCVLLYALNDLHLSSADLSRVLYDAHRLAAAIDTASFVDCTRT